MKRAAFKFIIVLFVLVSLPPIFGQDKPTPPEAPPQYSLGDQTFAINLGPIVPLFFLSFAPAVFPTNLFPVGLVGSLQWQAYLGPRVRLGGELGGLAAFSPNLNPLLMAYLTPKITYTFPLYPFEIPLSIGLGADLVTYQGKTTIGPLIKPEASFYWVFNSSWSFGLNVSYWFDMQFAADPTQSRCGNFLEISLSVLDHF